VFLKNLSYGDMVMQAN